MKTSNSSASLPARVEVEDVVHSREVGNISVLGECPFFSREGRGGCDLWSIDPPLSWRGLFRSPRDKYPARL